MNRVQKKEVRRAAALEFQERLKAQKLLLSAATTRRNKEKHRIENKRKQVQIQEEHTAPPYWTACEGLFSLPTPKAARSAYKGSMCPVGLVTLHKMVDTLLDYATKGCQVKTGYP